MNTKCQDLARGVLVREKTQWRVLHTKSRQEKAVGSYLEASGEDYYLPLIDRVTYVGERRFVSRIPLFPGYVFHCGDLSAAYEAISTRRVCRIIEVRDQERILREIEQVRAALERGAHAELAATPRTGLRFRVAAGPFAGIVGLACRELGDNRLALEIRVLGQSAVIEIDGDLLEPVD